MNKPTYGSQPIKNEQSGYQPTIDTMNPTPPQGNLDAIVFQEELLESQIQHILTAAKVSTVDEVVQMFDRHPFSDEDIERAASKYAFENNTHRSNSKAFIAGANFAKQPHLNEWVKVSERLPKVEDKFGTSDYLLCVDDTSVIITPFVAWYSKTNNTWTVAHYLASSESVNVTHWMPLPHPPKK